MKVVVAAFNQEKALVGAFSVITNLRVDLRLKLYTLPRWGPACTPPAPRAAAARAGPPACTAATPAYALPPAPARGTS